MFPETSSSQYTRRNYEWIPYTHRSSLLSWLIGREVGFELAQIPVVEDPLDIVGVRIIDHNVVP